MLNDGVFAFFGINSHYIDFQNKKYLHQLEMYTLFNSMHNLKQIFAFNNIDMQEYTKCIIVEDNKKYNVHSSLDSMNLDITNYHTLANKSKLPQTTLLQ